MVKFPNMGFRIKGLGCSFPIWGLGFRVIRGPKYIPQNTIILTVGTLSKVALILGNAFMGLGVEGLCKS